jgi:hypothetical protein
VLGPRFFSANGANHGRQPPRPPGQTVRRLLDPFAALAQTQQQLHDRLLELTPTSSPELQAAWRAAAEAIAEGADLLRPSLPLGPE